MKATGIVRRMDELGRVVIPKEIRKTYRIKEGDPIEIFVNSNGELILKKHSPVIDLGGTADAYTEALAATTGHTVYITDTDAVIAAAGVAKKDYIGKPIPEEMYKTICARKNVVNDGRAIAPILMGGDIFGAVVMLPAEKNAGQTELTLCAAAAAFLATQLA